VLKINQDGDPDNRAVVAVASGLCAIAYSKERITADRVPNQLGGRSKPEFKGKKLVVDVRPIVWPLDGCPRRGMGAELRNASSRSRTRFGSCNTRALTAISVGEYVMHQLTNYHSCVRATWKR